MAKGYYHKTKETIELNLDKVVVRSVPYNTGKYGIVEKTYTGDWFDWDDGPVLFYKALEVAKHSVRKISRDGVLIDTDKGIPMHNISHIDIEPPTPYVLKFRKVYSNWWERVFGIYEWVEES